MVIKEYNILSMSLSLEVNSRRERWEEGGEEERKREVNKRRYV